MIRFPEPDWEYRIFIYRNGELKKKYIGRKLKSKINEIYDRIVDNSNKTLFREEQILNPETGNYIGVKYHIVLFAKKKHYPDSKKFDYVNEVIVIEDYLGKKHEVSLKEYYITRYAEIFAEEEIYFCNNESYIYLDEIFNDFVANDKENYKQICVIGKILLIEHNDDFLAFRLKNEQDALRAHNLLRTLSIKKKLDKVLFFGNTLLFSKRAIYQKYLTDKNYDTI